MIDDVPAWGTPNQSRLEFAAHRWAAAESELQAVNEATAALFDAPRSTPQERKAASDARDELDLRRKRIRVEHDDATAMLLEAVEADRER